MKLKNKLLSIFSVLLLSCQYSPAYADVVEQDSIIFPVSIEKQEYIPCLAISDFSFIAMLAHQNGVSEEAQLSLAPVPTTQEEAVLKVLLDGIIHDANIFPVYVEPVHNVITQVFDGLKKAGLTAAKTVGECVIS